MSAREGIDGRERNGGKKTGRMNAKKKGDEKEIERERERGKRKIGACESTVKARNLNSLRFTLIAVQKSRHSHRVLHGSLPLPSPLLLLTMTLLSPTFPSTRQPSL